MINPINKPADFNRSVQTEKNSSTKDKTQVEVPATDQPKEEIHLSEAFREIEKLREIIDNTSEIHHTRIQYLKTLVDNGEYVVDSKSIVNRMINE
ncbi:flagellar biosynthesis anti-sigma factor FlgM [Legionella sp. W05-934-2]|jgi:flagellar biosynthesis anti-sigma factor FlgM|uniref:flagellar biosynthesis anti-sigma factor FlgM n=1 Tax=Legionella sp. W05-934-2 TaxID=1198649 RepID=UPI0034624148